MPRFLKSAPLLILLGCAVLQADPILVGPIEISGSGSFTFVNTGPGDTTADWDLNFSGSNSTDSIFGSGVTPNTSAGLAFQPVYGVENVLSAPLSAFSSMGIDGIGTGCSGPDGCHYGSFYFAQVTPGEWAGSATLYDSLTGNPVISASLVGDLIITGETDSGGLNKEGTPIYRTVSFNIVNAPEPATLSLLGIGVMLLIARHRKSERCLGA